MGQQKLIFVLIVTYLFLGLDFLLANEITYKHGVAMHGDLKYPKNFKKFDYANELAHKGGEVKLSAIGTFDNLNPYILKGVAAWQAAYLFESLMKSSFDNCDFRGADLRKAKAADPVFWLWDDGRIRRLKLGRVSSGNKKITI